jgi:hypothetical protein
MKSVISKTLILLFAVCTYAQEGINYKALIKDGGGALVAGQMITVQFQILQGAGMNNVYQETHTPTTDANGIIVITIGDGAVNSGVFDNINWGSDDHFLNTQINTGVGLVDMGTSAFNAVPYALSAKTVENITEIDPTVATTTPNSMPVWDGSSLVDGSLTDVSGNVGIGTASPSANLDIEGSFQFKDGTEGEAKLLTSDAQGNAIWQELNAVSILGAGGLPAPDFSCMSSVSSETIGTRPLALAVSGNYTYVVDSDTDDLKVIDVSDVENPIVVGTLGLGSKPRSITVTGNYAYIMDSGSDDIKVVDISDPTNPTLTASVSLGSASGNPNYMTISGSYAYITDVTLNYLKIVDISTPSAPVVAGSVTYGSSLGSVAVSGNYAYTVDSASDKLKVIDVSAPGSPTVSSATLSLGAHPFEIKISGNYAYVSDIVADDIKVIDISTPTSPSIVSTFGVGTRTSSMELGGNYMYLTDFDLDIVSIIDITNPLALSSVTSLGVGATPVDVVISGNYAYVIDQDSDDIKVIQLSCAFAVGVYPDGSFSTVTESDPIYSAWDKSTGISITESQISDLNHFTTGDETDPKVASITTNSVPVWDGSSLVDGSITDLGGNIGIGTTAITNKLEVAGDVLVNGLTIGRGAGNNISNVAIGSQALFSNTTGVQNVANGSEALFSNTTGWYNVANGFQALYSNTTGSNNIASGKEALSSNTTGMDNVAIGWRTLYYNNTGFRNVGSGRQALYLNTEGNDNIASGYRALYNNTTGGANLASGRQALSSNIIGSNNVAIGNLAGFNSLGTGNVFLGNEAGYNETGSDKLYIDNSNTSDPLLYGDFATNELQVNGSLNINDAYDLPTTDGTANYVMSTDGAGVATWADPATLGTTTNTLNQAYDEGGAGAGRVIDATDGAVRINGDDGFLVTGTNGSGDAVEVSGTGTRMFFNPKKAAFRAGFVNGTGWDDANIGQYSTALGHSTVASGDNSTALGGQTVASGLSSTALGFTTDATGSYSTAMGRNTTASGHFSTAMGYLSLASGANSMATGLSTTASGDYSTAFGSNTIASGGYSTAMGSNTIASQNYSTAMGKGTISSGPSSTAMGNETIASGNTSTAMGYITEALGKFSTVMGIHTRAKSYAETAIGQYNTEYTALSSTAWNAADRLFVVGNGTGTGVDASNALTIYKDGTMNINDAYDLPKTDGTVNYIMSTDGAGVATWVAPASLAVTEAQTLADVVALGNSVDNQLKNLTDPTDAQDAATKGYIDALIATFQAQITALEAQVPTAAVGDLRAGGVVFWVDPADNRHGLVCAIEDQSAGIQWYNGSFTTTGATATGIGTGSANTTAIILSQGAVEADYAAGLARGYNGGGFNDWFLPSTNELKEIYANQATLEAAPGFIPFENLQRCWASTEHNDTNAKIITFETGNIFNNGKTTMNNVRAVRAF